MDDKEAKRVVIKPGSKPEKVEEKIGSEPAAGADKTTVMPKPLTDKKKHKVEEKSTKKESIKKAGSNRTFGKDFWLFVRRNSYKLIFVLVIFVLAIIAILVARSFEFSKTITENNAALTQAQVKIDSLTAETEKATPDITLPTTEEDDECQHDWSITYKTEHHDAVTHTETVEPVYAEETSYHTVCNDCKQTIDGKADEHIAQTGHSGYTTNVPIVNTVLVSEGYTKEVVDQDAYDETIADKLVCTKCGAEKEITTVEK